MHFHFFYLDFRHLTIRYATNITGNGFANYYVQNNVMGKAFISKKDPAGFKSLTGLSNLVLASVIKQ